MDILFYSPLHSQKEPELLSSFQKSLQYNVFVIRNLDNFIQCSKNYRVGNAVAIVHAQTMDDLVDVYFYHHLFLKIPLILLIPDSEKDTIALGQRLRPLYIECVRDNSCLPLADIVGVIDKNKKSFSTPWQRKFLKRCGHGCSDQNAA